MKAADDHWIVSEKRGRKVISRGVWASGETIDWIRLELEAERATEGFAKRQAIASRRREKEQAEYVEDFFTTVLQFLAFHPHHADNVKRMA